MIVRARKERNPFHTTMEALLELLEKDARLSVEEIATRLGSTAAEVAARLDELTAEGILLGYHTVLDRDKINGHVSALIEVKLTPERDGGFDKIALRIAKFDQVRSCFLMSGGFDLAVFVEGSNLRDVAQFVSARLSTIQGVLSTATHFRLKIYKQDGFLAISEPESERLAITP